MVVHGKQQQQHVSESPDEIVIETIEETGTIRGTRMKEEIRTIEETGTIGETRTTEETGTIGETGETNEKKNALATTG